MNLRYQIAGLAMTALTVLGASACNTEAYCFDCDPLANQQSGGSSGNGGAGGTAGGGIVVTGGSGGTIGFGGSSSGGSANCIDTEICDGLDNDCNGTPDDGIDFSDIRNCGNCDTNCLNELPGADQNSIVCTPPDVVGKTPGTCSFTACAADYWDADNDQTNGCEYYCVWNPDGTNTSDPGGENGCNKDDDCDGTKDEDVDTCSDTDCGHCGHKCTLPNAVSQCAKLDATATTCTDDNTQCQVKSCSEGYYDLDKSPNNGCEYQCDQTNGGKEICDGLDNNCDGLTDNQDPLLEADDPDVKDTCYGGTQGECAKSTHKGVKKCIAAAIQCCDLASNNSTGTNSTYPATGVRNGVCEATAAPAGVIEPGDVPETCNNLDDNCDGQVDNNVSDDGGSCGPSTGICVAGNYQCISGDLVCVTPSSPSLEVCNNTDDDCDGVVDGTVPTTVTACTGLNDASCPSGQFCMAKDGGGFTCAKPPADVADSNGFIACNVPPSACWDKTTGVDVACPPANGNQEYLPSGCTAGTLACVSGQKQCQGATSGASIDACGADSNCNGAYEGAGNFKTDVNNCGSCGNKCGVNEPNTAYTCTNGVCTKAGCQPGFIDCTGAAGCETACVFRGAELCNGGIDDDCDCKVDGADTITTKPTPDQVCGVTNNAQVSGDPQCRALSGSNTKGVNITCDDTNSDPAVVQGAWTCHFQDGYCSTGNCTTSPDPCDNPPSELDQNCDGTANEELHSPFRTVDALGAQCFSDDGEAPPGDGACRVEGTYICNGTSDTICSVAGAPDLTLQSQELCNGEDDDCDGLVDEYKNQNSVRSYVKPNVVAVGAKYMFQFEASRAGATATDPGTGNGYWDDLGSVPPDSTVACSVSNTVPWFNVTPKEAEETCTAIGGRVCTVAEWQTACHAQNTCTWGYQTADCNNANGSSYCNMESFSESVLETQSGDLSTCYAQTASGNIYDITGNLREITDGGSAYNLMGGAFSSDSASGATCDFTFYSVGDTFSLYDTGFRCCFDADPR